MRKNFVFAWLALSILLCVGASFAVKDGSQYADGYTPIVFPNITAADTTESVRCMPLHKEIAYYINIISRHKTGLMVSDTVYVILKESAEDTNYVNVSSINETKTLTVKGTSSLHYDFLSSGKYTRLEIPRMTDSLTVQIKAVISPREGR